MANPRGTISPGSGTHPSPAALAGPPLSGLPPPLQHLQLRLAADAARDNLGQLRQEYGRLRQRLVQMNDSMQMLQNVIDAWECLNPARDPLSQQLRRIDREMHEAEQAPLPPASPLSPSAEMPQHAPGIDQIALGRRPQAWPVRGDIVERVHRVMLGGNALSPNEAHAAIDVRFRSAYSVNAVSIAMRQGAEVGRYLYNGKTGKYRIAAAA